MSLSFVPLSLKGSKNLSFYCSFPLLFSSYSSQISRPLPKTTSMSSQGSSSQASRAQFNANVKAPKAALMSPSIFQKYKEFVQSNAKKGSRHDGQKADRLSLPSETEPAHQQPDTELAYVLSRANKRRLTWKEKENLPERPELSLASQFSIGSPQKLNELGRQISRLTLAQAIVQMQFSPKRAALKVLSTLLLLKAKAEAMPYMTPELLSRMTIHAATVGRGKILKRLDIKARGRTGIRRRIFSHIRITLKEPNLATIYRKKFKFHIQKENKPVYFKLNY